MSNDYTNTGIYLSANGHLSLRRIDEPYTPTGDQSLVRIEYSAINPADIRHAFMGLHSSVTGYDWVGQVIAIGGQSPFKIGEKVFGFGMPGRGRKLWEGAHQNYMLAARYVYIPVAFESGE